MSFPTETPPPGWYPNPRGETHWWNGTNWAPPPITPDAPRKGLALSALIVGIGAFFVGWVPILGAVLGAAGLVLGAVALMKGQSKGVAVTGVVVASLAIVASITMTVIVYASPWDEIRHNLAGEAQAVASPTPSAGAEEPAPKPEPAAPADSGTESYDQAMTSDGWDVVESGNLYAKFADPADYTCGYAKCAYVQVITLKGCPTSLYVEASLMQGGTVIGMTNDLLGAVGPEGTAAALLEDFAGNADSFQLTKINCY